MKNTTTKKFNAALKEYLVPIIADAARDRDQSSPENPFSWVLGTAKREVPNAFKRHSEQGGMEYWLSGLGMNIAYYNSAIVLVAERLHGCELSDKEAEKVVANWFNFMAFKICQFARQEQEQGGSHE